MDKFTDEERTLIRSYTTNLINGNVVDREIIDSYRSYEVFVTMYDCDSNMIICRGAKKEEKLSLTIMNAVNRVMKNISKDKLHSYLLTFIYNFSDLRSNSQISLDEGVYLNTKSNRTFLLPSFLKNHDSDDLNDWIDYGKCKMNFKSGDNLRVKIFKTIEIKGLI